jgi:hypothetical protein
VVDGRLAFAGVVFLVVGLVLVAAPRGLWQATAAWQYRTPRAMAPTLRRARVARYSGSVYLVGGLGILVACAWPGETVAKAWAGSITVWAGMVVAVVVVVLARVVTSRRRAGAPTAAPDDEDSPSEPSEEAYGLAYLGITIHAVAALAITAIVLGGLQPRVQPSADPWPTSADPSVTAAVDEATASFRAVHDEGVPVVAAAGADQTVVAPFEYVPISAETRSPHDLWYASHGTTSQDPSASLAHASVALAMPAFGCSAQGVLVQETDTDVVLGIVVAADDPGLATRCIGGTAVVTDFFLARLAAPIGARTVHDPAGQALALRRST